MSSNYCWCTQGSKCTGSISAVHKAVIDMYNIHSTAGVHKEVNVQALISAVHKAVIDMYNIHSTAGVQKEVM